MNKMISKFKTGVFTMVTLLLAQAAFAAAGSYNCNTIPEGLKKHADAVIRDFHEEIVVKSPHEIYVTTRIAITILNEKGKRFGMMNEWYDHFRKIEQTNGRLYDKNGDEIDKMKQKAVKDYGPSVMGFVDDDRFKSFEFDYSIYPYTCVFEVEKRLDYSFLIPAWVPKESFDCAVEKADIEVIYPKDFPLRYRTFHLGKQPTVTAEDNTNKLTLSLSDLPAGNRPDEFTPPENYHMPAIIFAADNFEFDNRPGSQATWNDFGKFFYDLNAGRDELPPEMVQTVHRLTDTCYSNAQKIGVLYRYLQKNTRYVSIQLGIGGWQTFDAKFVAEKGYGDCKALSNYMKAMLKAAGINAYAALVYGGEKESRLMMQDFPCNEFNHVILCVPGQHDSTWLECTAKNLPAGYLSNFTANRSVLLITPEGGVPVRTPDYNMNVNRAKRNADIYINDKDELSGNIELKYSGYLWDKEQGAVADEPKSKVDNYLNSKFSISTYSIGTYKIDNDLSRQIPSVSESIAISGSGNISRSGKNIFLSSSIMPLHILQPDTYEKRKNKFHISHSYMVTDTILFHLTGAYTMAGPLEKKLDFPFASYRYRAEFVNDGLLRVTVLYTQQEGDYEPELYPDYIELSKEINKTAANERIALLRKD